MRNEEKPRSLTPAHNETARRPGLSLVLWIGVLILAACGPVQAPASGSSALCPGKTYLDYFAEPPIAKCCLTGSDPVDQDQNGTPEACATPLPTACPGQQYLDLFSEPPVYKCCPTGSSPIDQDQNGTAESCSTTPEPTACSANAYYSPADGPGPRVCCPPDTTPIDQNGNGIPESCAAEALTISPGTSLQWWDGSTLVAMQDDEGRRFWGNTRPISRYQHWLCVQAGACQPLPGETEPPLNTSMDAFSNVEGLAFGFGYDYCAWVGGRLPDGAEKGIIIDYFPPGQGIGVVCVFDEPGTTTPMCRASAFYDPSKGPPGEENFVIASIHEATFCQGDVAYATGLYHPPEGANIVDAHAVGPGTCELLPASNPNESNPNERTVLCYGQPDSSVRVEIMIQWKTDPDAWLMCPPGFESDSAYPALCNFMPGILDEKGCTTGTTAIALQGGGYYCMTLLAGTMRTPPQYSSSPELHPACATGQFPHPALNDACVSPDAAVAGCPKGFAYADALKCCKSTIDLYPGCPGDTQVSVPPILGVAPSLWGAGHGACDSWFDYRAEGFLAHVMAQMNLPTCGGGMKKPTAEPCDCRGARDCACR